MKDREIAFWLLSKFCGDTLCNLDKVDFNNRIEKVCFDYINKGCNNRDDYEFLVENFRIFQHLEKDNWIIEELLK